MIKVGAIGKIVAGCDGGCKGMCHRIATFTPQDAAASLGSATVVAQNGGNRAAICRCGTNGNFRRERGRLALLLRHGPLPLSLLQKLELGEAVLVAWHNLLLDRQTDVL